MMAWWGGQNKTDDNEPEKESKTIIKPRTKPPLARGNEHYRVQQVKQHRIHILGGTGSIGNLVAHSLRGIPNPPPVTLLLHSAKLMRQWEDSSRELRLTTDNVTESRSGYDAELAVPTPRYHGREMKEEDPYTYQGRISPDRGLPHASNASVHRQEEGLLNTDQIDHLIVCVKAPKTVTAIGAVAHRLHRDSTILFLQNGMGIPEEVSRELFPDPSTRPYYMQGIVSHGVRKPTNRGSGGYDSDPFCAIHAGQGTIGIGLIPREQPNSSLPSPIESTETWAQSARYLLKTVTRSPALCALGFAPSELLQLQLEKLAINCVVNPLTVLLDSRNGALLFNYAITRAMRLLLYEISLVIKSMPELRGLPNLSTRFSRARLETLTTGVLNQTKDNVSSMLADARKGTQTEIDYINGYIVKRGEELGLKCVMNYLIVQLIRGKGNLLQRELAEELPFVSMGGGSKEGSNGKSTAGGPSRGVG